MKYTPHNSAFSDLDFLILSPMNFNILMKQPLDFAAADSE